MSTTEPETTTTHPWEEVERFLAKLQQRARSTLATEEFYRELLAGCVTLLAAPGGAVWRREQTRWNLLTQIHLNERHVADPRHQDLLRRAASDSGPSLFHAGNLSLFADQGASESAVMVGPVESALCTAREDAPPLILVEFAQRAGCSPEVQRGWLEFLSAVCRVAAEHHLYAELRRLREAHQEYGRVLSLLERIHRSNDLKRVGAEVVNEGCHFICADRLSLVVNQNGKWNLLGVSGVDTLQPYADTVKTLETLAAVTAVWGDIVEYADVQPADQVDLLPSSVAQALRDHVDAAHSRRLVAVPLRGRDTESSEAGDRMSKCQAVLVAEAFSVDREGFSRQHLLELAHFCESAVGNALELDSFPLRTALRWSHRWRAIHRSWGLNRVGLVFMAAIVAIVALVAIRVDYEVEAPATLIPVVERDVFATTSGTLRDIRVSHGDHVAKRDVLAVLSDPKLEFEIERVAGQIATTKKRLEAIAVQRTNRRNEEDLTADRLPLSAESEQLQLQLSSLKQQEAILRKRKQSLTLCSPLGGTVLTMDVQNLLQDRPVERGQVLFTVADVRSGWKLDARVAQDRIGHLLSAISASKTVRVRFRLKGESDQVYTGHVSSVGQTALLDQDAISGEIPEIPVEIAIDERDLAPARPGMAAQVRIDCGRRSLGYVWLHDAWENIYSWLAF